MTSNASKVYQEKPLLGAVLCCTSIAPEERTRLAEYALSMGAEHKLDLTSDVTHLIVGSTNTPKYAYVAKEREDVRVLQPAWVEAVRERWMEAKSIDMNALEVEYRVPTLAGLKICITGFDDLEFRAYLAKNVNANGGEYTGDLTKDVTHLIAHEPAGKKYDYATQWAKKVVTLKWYQDTLERGMQLEESTYHPLVPVERQGVGAWNRLRRHESTLGKRVREEQQPQEPARKLRRTASAKYGGQADNVWNDIASAGSGNSQSNQTRDVLRTTKSMSAIQPHATTETKDPHLIKMDHEGEMKEPQVTGQATAYLTGTYFAIEGFSSKQTKVLSKIVSDVGAHVSDSIDDLMASEATNSTNSFIIVPYTTRQSALPYLGKSEVRPNIVTELWIERCMVQKSFISPDQYPLGGIINEPVAQGVERLLINATGFHPMETLHISKIVRLMGSKYSEAFTRECSVLICNSANAIHTKLIHAREWKVSAVAETWLWQLLKTGAVPAYDKYSSESLQGDDDNDIQQALDRKRRNQQPKSLRDGPHVQSFSPLDDGFDVESKQGAASMLQNNSETRAQQIHGKRNTTANDQSQKVGRQKELIHSQSSTSQLKKPGSMNGPLQEVSPNSPTKRNSPVRSKPRVPAFDGGQEFQENMSTEIEAAQEIDTKFGDRPQSPIKSGPDTTSMNSAIQDLLDLKAKAKAKANAQSSNQDEPSRGKNKRLLGRALSNLSNSSHKSNPRQSRASSIDSLNTDGVGSELGMPSANSTTNRHPSFTLKGRAQPSLKHTSSLPAMAQVDLSDPNLCRDEFADPDPAPPMTQLGYEDSDEAIALREKLAEKRRARTRIGQKETDPPPDISAREREETRRKRVLRDDETVIALEAAGGWGGGRRTRNRAAKEKDDDVLI